MSSLVFNLVCTNFSRIILLISVIFPFLKICVKSNIDTERTSFNMGKFIDTSSLELHKFYFIRQELKQLKVVWLNMSCGR